MARRLIQLMDRDKLNANQLGKKCGVDQSTINRWVNAVTKPTLESVERKQAHRLKKILPYLFRLNPLINLRKSIICPYRNSPFERYYA